VVIGDVVMLAAGASVPADARLLTANDLFVDQSTLTGESYPSAKEPGVAASDAGLAERGNVIHMGTHVVSGMATAVVARTGAGTEFGAIAHRLELRPPATEFEHGIRRFGHLLLWRSRWSSSS
jgi:Mg2+-importing ATPase